MLDLKISVECSADLGNVRTCNLLPPNIGGHMDT